MIRSHTTIPYLLNPTHRVTVILVGCGGTGGQVLSGLARMNQALIKLGHPGLMVTVYDGDIVTETNPGRQLYNDGDMGRNKAVLSVSRVNRFFGTDWDAVPVNYGRGTQGDRANIFITCVDTAKTRVDIGGIIAPKRRMIPETGEPTRWRYYWMDFGNGHKTGQVVLGSLAPGDNLRTVVELFPKLKRMKEKDSGPSCSLAQALGKQDLFINSALAQLGMNILWKLFREGRIVHQGCYLNLETMCVNPIKV